MSTATPPSYDFGSIEDRWRRAWRENGTYRTPEPQPGQRTFYVLDMFPFPSGSGLHVGHPVGYLATDIVARYRRACGDVVLHPMGWDSFGLPAEQHAIRTGEAPKLAIERNIGNFRRQMDLIGLSYDWDREITTSAPDYYRWTQYLFLKLHDAWFDAETQRARPIAELPVPDDVAAEGGLAVNAYVDARRLVYFASAPVNYCPELGTVLANEEVYDGRTEQGYEVIRVSMPQVIMRISVFADRLLAGLDKLDWPEGIKETQRNWIGRSEGLEVDFRVGGQDEGIATYTTRAETLSGVTFLAVAPEYKQLDRLITDAQRDAIAAYVDQASRKSDLSRTTAQDKTGEFTGSYALNPLTDRRVPIYVADYVLADYGTGAVMGVPAHDDRDWEFARNYGLEIVPVVRSPDAAGAVDGAALTGEGVMIADPPAAHAGAYRAGQPIAEARDTISSYGEQHGFARRSIRYNIRDWIFARQRYWGEPIPVIHWDDGTTSAVAESELPLLLPYVEDYKPAGEGKSALARATDWIAVVDPETGRTGVRETATMPNWAGSCWYPLRFTDPHNDAAFADRDKLKAWGPVDLYVGGAEHATLHLLYARFWYQAFYDLGLIPYPEPFTKLVNQGMLTSFAYKDDRGVVIAVDEVEPRDDGSFVRIATGETVERITTKMSKSLRNVVTPDEVIDRYGSDAFRMYLMFMGPVEGPRIWDTDQVAATSRLLKRIWSYATGDSNAPTRAFCDKADESKEVSRAVATLIREITEDLDALRLNTAVAEIMKFMNRVEKLPVSRDSFEKLVVVLNPFAPFAAEELWNRLGNGGSVNAATWPAVEADEIDASEPVPVVLQIGGRKRGEIAVDAGIVDAALQAMIADHVRAKALVASGSDLKIIVVRDRATQAPKLANIVEKPAA